MQCNSACKDSDFFNETAQKSIYNVILSKKCLTFALINVKNCAITVFFTKALSRCVGTDLAKPVCPIFFLQLYYVITINTAQCRLSLREINFKIYMNKQKSFLFLLSVLMACYVQAQVGLGQNNRMLEGGQTSSATFSKPSPLSDEEIIEYIENQQMRGMSEKTIIMNLLRMGVPETKLTEIRESYMLEGSNSNNRLQNDRTLDRRRVADPTITNDSGIKEKHLDEIIPDSASLAQMVIELEEDKIEIFGHNIFKDREIVFEPNLNIATPENYLLGPGDEVIVDIWGASQSVFSDYISPDGYLNIDQVGPVYISGMTVKAANGLLRNRYGQIFSGLTDENPNADIKLTLGQIRSIQVRVMGEVVSPGTYTVSAFASLFHALYLAGGVTDIGSLRNIKVSRGNRVVATLDVYEYLLKGSTSGDIRLSDGDVITVPTYDRLVDVAGKVKRPMFYEMKEGETAADLLEYSGGFARDAFRTHVNVERFGDNGMQLFTLDEEGRASFLIKDGDHMVVDSISDLYENLVEVKGAVYRPGKVQLGVVSTVKELINGCGGLRPDAFLQRAILNRRLPDMSMENLSLDIAGIMSGSVADVELRNYDVLYISSIEEVQDIKYVNIYGEVAFPGKYRYAQNTKVGDLVLMAGGLNDKASTARVEVVRRIYNPAATEAGDSSIYIYILLKLTQTFQ